MKSGTPDLESPVEAEHDRPPSRRPRAVFAAAAVLLLAFAGSSAWLYLRHKRTEGLRGAGETLTAVADLKLGQIVRWRLERLTDANLVHGTPYAARRALDALAQPDSVTTRLMFTSWLDPLLAGGLYQRVILLDAELNVRLVHPAGVSPALGAEARELAERALRTESVIASDLLGGAEQNSPTLSFCAPLVVRREGLTDKVPAAGIPPSVNDRAAGVLILETRADEFLFPLIGSWPTPSPTAETLLVRQEQDQIVYLNTVRHRPGAPLSLRIPYANGDYVTTMAVQGRVGLVEGLDYRGVPVLAVLRQIPDTRWFLVAKLDKAEVLAPLQRQVGLTALIAGLLVLASLLSVGLAWRQHALAHSRRELAERRTVELALRDSEERHRLVTANSKDAILLTVPDGGIVQANPAACRMFGRSESELRACGRAAVVDPSDPRLPAALDERRRNGHFVGELTLLRRDGSRFPAELASTVFKDQKGRPRTSLIIRDITQRKQLEQERTAMEANLRQQQRLESIGTLASGVAHEINNPINGIMNYAQLIQDRLPPESPLSEFTGEILRETERVTLIVRNLLTFARTDKQSHSRARMQDILEGTLSLFRTVIRHDQIALTVSVPDDLPALDCRSQQIQQVLMNLMTNARDALNERYPDPDPNKVLIISAQPMEKSGRQWVRVTVEDHGTGITPEIRAQMFDPFFTTKGRDRGTGLGLSISHGIVKEHHGELTVESQPGVWTRLFLELPVDNTCNL